MGNKEIIFILFFLIVPASYGAELDLGSTNVSSHVLLDNIKLGPGGTYGAKTCEQIDTINNDLIHKFCFQVQTNIIWLIAISMILWIVEPAVKKNLSKIDCESSFWNHMLSDGAIAFIIKWIGLGLMFMAIYSLKVMM